MTELEKLLAYALVAAAVELADDGNEEDPDAVLEDLLSTAVNTANSQGLLHVVHRARAKKLLVRFQEMLPTSSVLSDLEIENNGSE